MSGFFRAQVRLPRVSGLAEDDVVNVFHFDSEQTFAADADGVADRILTFYQAIDFLYSDQLSGVIQIKMYDMADAEPRVPGYTLNGALTIPSGTNLPSEVALCLSFRGAAVSGVNMARRRGRVYLGPFNTSIGVTELGGDVRPNSTYIGNILDAAAAMAHGSDPADGKLAVYSPTTHATGTLDEAYEDVTYIWMDNAFDTMRSRGAKATASYNRTSF